MFNEFRAGQIEFLGALVFGLHQHRTNTDALRSDSNATQGVRQNIGSKTSTSKVAAYGQSAND